MAEQMPQLWLSNNSRVACARDDCLAPEGSEVFGRSERRQQIVTRNVGTNQGEIYERLDETSIHELAPLLATTGHFTLQCAGGHVEYDMAKHELVFLIQPATTTAETA